MSVVNINSPKKPQHKNDRFIGLMVSCINPLNESAREFQKYLLNYTFVHEKPNIEQLKKIRRDIAIAHHLVCDMISEANRLDVNKVQTDLLSDDDFCNDRFDESE